MRSRSPADRSPFATYAAEVATGAEVGEGFDKAQADARQALALAPDLAQAHLALARVFQNGTLDFTQASEAYERALRSRRATRGFARSGVFAAIMGHFDAGIAATPPRRRARPARSQQPYGALGEALYAARRYEEAVAAFAEVISLDPDFKGPTRIAGLPIYGLGDLEERARLMRDPAGRLGTVNSVWRWSTTSSGRTRMRKPSLRN